MDILVKWYYKIKKLWTDPNRFISHIHTWLLCSVCVARLFNYGLLVFRKSMEETIWRTDLEQDIDSWKRIVSRITKTRLCMPTIMRLVQGIGKHRALSREVKCKFRINLKIGRTSVKPRWTHRLFTSNYRCLHCLWLELAKWQGSMLAVTYTIIKAWLVLNRG